MHEIAQDIRNRLFKGKPRWLALRMLAWHQVTESRRGRSLLPEPAKPGETDDVPSATSPSPSGSSSDFSQDWAGLMPAASSNGHGRPSAERTPSD